MTDNCRKPTHHGIALALGASRDRQNEENREELKLLREQNAIENTAEAQMRKLGQAIDGLIGGAFVPPFIRVCKTLTRILNRFSSWLRARREN